MKKPLSSRLLAMFLCVALLVGTVPFTMSVSAADNKQKPVDTDTYAALGLSVSPPSVGDPNEHPYGKGDGKVPLITVNELSVFMQDRDDVSRSYSVRDLKPGSAHDSGFWGSQAQGGGLTDSADTMQRPVIVAADLNNSGKKDQQVFMAADGDGYLRLGIGSLSANGNLWNVGFLDYTDSNGDKKNMQTEEGIDVWMSEGVYQAAAGNFDGKPGDEIAVYVPRLTGTGSRIHIYQYDQSKKAFKLWTWYLLPGEFQNPGRKGSTGEAVSSLPTVTLSAGDVTHDGRDDLAITIGAPVDKNAPSNWTKTDSKLIVFDESTFPSADLDNQQITKESGGITLAGSADFYVSQDAENDGTKINYSFNVTSPGAGIGDVNGDKLNDIAVAGRFGNKTLSGSSIIQQSLMTYAVSYVKYDHKTKTYTLADDWQVVFGGEYDIGTPESNMLDPVTVACANIEGDTSKVGDVVFVEGQLLRWQQGAGALQDYPKPITDALPGGFAPYDNSDMVGDNTDKNAVYLSSSPSDSRKWIQQAVVGNFDGNVLGKEQIVYLYAKRSGSLDSFYWDAGVFGGLNTGGYKASLKGNVQGGGYISLCASDVDDDSLIAQFKSKRTTISHPEVLAVLVSPPFFRDLASDDAYDVFENSATEFGITVGGGNSASRGTDVTIGTYVAFEHDLGFMGLKAASIEAEASLDFGFTYDFIETDEWSETVSYITHGGTDSVALIAVPLTIYTYEVFTPSYKVTQADLDAADSGSIVVEGTSYGLGDTVPDHYQDMEISVPDAPARAIVDVDNYDKIAAVTDGLDPIRGNILHSYPGEPETYSQSDAAFNPLKNKTDDNNTNMWYLCQPQGGNEMRYTYEASQGSESSYQYSMGASGKVGAGVGGVIAGIQGSAAGTWGHATSDFSGVSYSASVYNMPPTAVGYGFTWKFGVRNARLNGDTIPVLDYAVKNVSSLPSVVQDLTVIEQTTNSITLGWTLPGRVPVYPDNGYLIQRWDENTGLWQAVAKVGSKNSHVLTYQDPGLLPLTSYQYRIVSLGAGSSSGMVTPEDWDQLWGGEKSAPSLAVDACTYADEKTGPKILKQPADLTVYDRQSADFSVEADLAEGTQTGDLLYQWYQVDNRGYRTTLKDDDNVTGAKTNALSLKSVTQDMDRYEYYCEVTQYIQRKRATIATERATLTVNGTQATVELVLTDTNNKLLKSELEYDAGSGLPKHYGFLLDNMKGETVRVHAKLSWPEGLPAPTGDIDFTAIDSYGNVLNQIGGAGKKWTWIKTIGEQDGGDAGKYTGAYIDWTPDQTGSLSASGGFSPNGFLAVMRGDSVYSEARTQLSYYVFRQSYGSKVAGIIEGVPQSLYYGDTIDIRAYLVNLPQSSDTPSVLTPHSGEGFGELLIEASNNAGGDAVAKVTHKSGDVWTIQATDVCDKLLVQAKWGRQSDSNYIWTYADPLIPILPRPVTVTAEDARIQVGEKMPVFKASISDPDCPEAIKKEVLDNIELQCVGDPEVPGRYSIRPVFKNSFAKADYYNPKLESGTLTVSGVYHAVDYSAGANGTLSAEFDNKAFGVRSFADGDSVLKTSTVSFAAAPNKNFVVKNWTVNGKVLKDEDGSNFIGLYHKVESLDEDLTVRVEFERARYMVSYSAEGGGSVSAKAGGVPLTSGKAYLAGMGVTFTAEPDEGYAVEGWWLNGKQVPGEFGHTLTIDSLDSTAEVLVKFRELERFTVSHEITGTGWGTVVFTLPDGGVLPEDGTVPYGTTVTATLTPEGSLVNSWTVNGQVKAEAGVLTLPFTVTENTHIEINMDSLTGDPVNIGQATVQIAGGPFVYNGRPHTPGVTVSLQGKELIQGTDYTVRYGENVDAGTGTIIIEGLSPYMGTKTCTFPIEKAAGAAMSAPTLESKAATSVTLKPVTAPENGQTVEYAVSQTDTAPADGWQDGVTFSGLSEYSDYHFFARTKSNSNYNTGAASGGTAIRTADATAPTGGITIKSNAFTAFLNSVTFGLFFKDTVDVTVTGADTGSGVAKTEFRLSETDLPENTDWETVSWTEGNKTRVTANWKGLVYARITDNEDNATVIRSDGVVVYTDSEAVSTAISHTKFSGAKTAEVKLNGNAISGINDGTRDLTPETDYTVSGGVITFTEDYLDGLAANDYTLTVSSKPMGLAYVEADGNDAPGTISISLTIRKAEQAALSISDPGEKTYGDAPFQLTATGGSSAGAVTFELVSGNGTVTPGGNVTITGAGSIVVKAIRAEDGDYNSVSSQITITVNKADPQVQWPTGLTATYGQALADLSLDAFTNTPAGTFDWTAPTDAVGDVGTRSHTMTFTPAESANYNTLTQDVNITVNPATINGAAVTVTSPVTGAVPNKTASGTGDFTVGDVTWTPACDVFKGSTRYTAQVTLTANAGYTFNGLTTATINGQKAAITENTGSTVTLTYEFAATGDTVLTGIEIASQPAKHAYTYGEALDLTGLTVRLLYNDGTDETVAFADFASKNVSASPVNGSQVEMVQNGTAVTVSCGEFTADTDTLTVSKATGAAMSAPTLESKTATSVTLKPVKAPANGQTVEYAVSQTDTAPESGWQDGVTFSGLSEYGEYHFFARTKSNGNYNTGAASGGTTVRTADETAPTGEITIKSNSFTTFLNTVSFGLFFKDTVDVTVTGADTGSGVAKTEYRLSETDLPENTDWETVSWTEGNKTSVTANWKGLAYARITDREDNVTVLRSDGVVVYTDSEAAVKPIQFTQGAGKEETVTVTLNGNTIDKVMNGTNSLVEGTDYTVSNGQITIKADYLNSLTAGDYTLKVSYNPLGETYEQGDAPAATVISLTIVPQYAITAGADQSWKEIAASSVTITCNGDLAKFLGLKIDGVLIDESNYTTQSGSTIITLKPAYLKTLTSGAHTVEFIYTDGSASTELTILAAEDPDPTEPSDPTNPGEPANPSNPTDPSPDTGDNSHTMLWFLLGGASLTVLGGMFVTRQKRKKHFVIKK